MTSMNFRNTAPPNRAGIFFGYVGLVMAVSAVILTLTAPSIGDVLAVAPAAFWALAVLAVVVDALPLSPPGPRQSAIVVMSTCFSYAILFGWGLGPAIVVQILATAVSSWRCRYTVWRAGFNAAQYTLSLSAAWLVLIAINGTEMVAPNVPLPAEVQTLVAVVGSAVAWLLVNHTMVSLAVFLRFGRPFWKGFLGNLGNDTLGDGALLALGPVLLTAAMHNVWLTPLIALPLYGVYKNARLSNDMEDLSRTDPLTGLPNRTALQRWVDAEIAWYRERGGGVALLVCDLDRFKAVNDAMGHAIGDQLLIEVGRRLSANIREGEHLARLGGDEFAIVVTGAAADPVQVAERLGAALNEPVQIGEITIDVAGAIGVARCPEHGTDFEALMQHADVAMYEAKRRGDPVNVYAPESDQNTPERLSLLGDLRRTLEDDALPGIELYWQPQVSILTGEVLGVEALLRYRHPKQGKVDPEELISLAEHSAVMRLLTFRVLDNAIQQLATWSKEGLDLRASVNVSVRDLQNPTFVEGLTRRLVANDVAPSQLQLEITESALMADPRRVLTTLKGLEALGVALSLDDFGTGFSSLQHLRRLPVSEVKIDRSFVLGMDNESGDDAAIVRSIIDLAGSLGLRVVAEGVEDETTWRALAVLGCDIAQGWFHARPMPADQLSGWLHRYRPPNLLLPPVRAAEPLGPAAGS
ncbi:EAL domain-containing protein [Phytomonospora sp. NPDC050363]|uniref:putative bifunctional diguanylate cyclase/phosphodiesterase n=1 Tax=Phytomonospora sp. NPDC050363 TaxID=3155642 RepID=UPI0033CB2999